jgi:hypothetical protein
MTAPTEDNHLLKIGLAQIAPVWLDRERTILKVKTYVERASQGCHLVAFGEAFVPGYPFWLELTDGARFNSSLAEIHFCRVRGASRAAGGCARRWIVRSGGCASHCHLSGNGGARGRPRRAQPLLFLDLHRSAMANRLGAPKADADLRKAPGARDCERTGFALFMRAD